MRRTTKEERKQNAKRFYQLLCGNGVRKAAVVIERSDNGTRTQFVTAYANGSYATKAVIAESAALGVDGCFYELVKSIFGGIVQTSCFESGFEDWLAKTCHMRITWKDGLVYMLEYSP